MAVPNLPDWVTQEAYSHEVSSCGFWPGGGAIPYPAFYSYAYPEPAGFAEAPVKPDGAFYSTDLREFILPYDIVRQLRRLRTKLFSISFRRRMKVPPIWPIGIAHHWNVHTIRGRSLSNEVPSTMRLVKRRYVEMSDAAGWPSGS